MSVRVIRRDGLPEHELVGRDHGGAGVCVIFVDAAPGEGPALHRHPYEEVFIPLEGEATFTVDGEEIVAGPDVVVIVPAGTPHAFRNTGSGRLRQIDVHVSPVFETEWL